MDDEIKIVITGQDRATTTLDKQISNLQALQTQISHVNDTLSKLGNYEKLSELSQALEKVGAASSGFARFANAVHRAKADDYTRFSEGLDELSSAIDSFNVENFEKVGNAANSISRMTNALRKVEPENYSNFYEGMKLVAKSLEFLDNVDPEKLANLAQIASNTKFSQFQKAISQQATPQETETTDLEDVQAESQEIEDTGTAATSASSRLDSFISNLRGIAAGAKAVYSALAPAAKSLGSFAVNAFKAVSPTYALISSMRSLSSRLRRMFSDVMRIVKYRAIRSLIRMITSSFTEGMKNAYQYAVVTGNEFKNTMDSLATSALYVKNSLGAMAMPLLNALAPAIDYIADKFVQLINLINHFFAVISGASTWTRALKYPIEYNNGIKNSASGAKKAADELKATILGLDELNLLNDQKDPSSGGGGGGGADAMDYGSMFETVETGTSALAESLSRLFDPFKKAWEAKGQGVIDSINYAFGSIKSLAGTIWDDFLDSWNSGSGQKIIENILGTFTNINTTIGNIASGLKAAWDENGNGKRIIENILGIYESISGIAQDISGYFSEWASEVDFGPLVSAVADLTGSVKDFIDNAKPAIEGLTEKFGDLMTWIVEKALPKVVNIIDELTRFGSALIGSITALFKGDYAGAKEYWQDFADYNTKSGKYAPQPQKNSREIYIQGKQEDILSSLGLPTNVSRESQRKQNELAAANNKNILEWLGENRKPGEGGKLAEWGNDVAEFWGRLIKDSGSFVGQLADFFFGGAGSLKVDTKSGVFQKMAESAYNNYLEKNGIGEKKTLTIDMLEGNVSKVGEIIQYMQEHSGTAGGKSVGAKAKLQTNITSKTDNITDKILSVFGFNTKTISLGYEMDGTQNKWDIKQWLNTKTKSFFNWLGYKQDGTEKQGFFTTWRTIIGRTIKNILGYNSDGSENNSNTKTWRTIVGRVLSNTLGYKMDGSQGNSNVKNWQGTTSSKSTFWKILGFKTDGSEGNSAVKNWFNASSSSVYKSLQMNLRLKVESIVAGKSASSGNTHAVSIIDQRFTYAQGGFPASGSVFVANENGPEYVGKFGSGTAVANNDQIVEGISQGVANANMEQNRLLREQNELLRALLEKDNGGNATSSSDVLRALSQMNRRTGRPVVSMN